MARSHFDRVESAARGLPDVEVTTARGKPALKVRGRMFACIASNKAAEPNTLVVWMPVSERDLLIAEEPKTYYIKDHYVPHPCVLVRLSRISPDALKDLLAGAHRFVGGAKKKMN